MTITNEPETVTADVTAPPELCAHPWIRLVAWTALILLAGLQAWGNRHSMNPDGISYLDLAKAAARNDWSQTVNAYWSPLYPWLLGIAFSILELGAFWEFTIAHLVNFGIFLLVLASFEFFLIQVLTARTHLGIGASQITPLPDWLWRVLGYSAFGWTMLVLIGLSLVTPDLLVAGIVFAASAIVVRLATRHSGTGWFIGLGAILGVGYLAKAPMLPFAAAFFFAAWLAGHPRRLRGIAIAGVALAAIAGPFVVALSQKEGRFTVGESGKLNYGWYVNGVPMFKNWQGHPSGTGTARNPTLVLDDPATHVFSQPIEGTYPLWYDPSHWHEGLVLSFDPLRQLRRIVAELVQLAWTLMDLFFPAAVLLLLLARRQIGVRWRPAFVLGLPAAVTVAMYMLVHVEARFLGGFLAVFLAGLLLVIRPLRNSGREATLVIVTALAMLFAVRVLGETMSDVDEIARQVRLGAAAHEHWRRATELHNAGLSAGTQIAVIGDGFRAYWAHLGRFRITGEVAADEFWSAGPDAREAAIAALANRGTHVVLSDSALGCPVHEGWVPIRNAGLCTYRAPKEQRERVP